MHTPLHTPPMHDPLRTAPTHTRPLRSVHLKYLTCCVLHQARAFVLNFLIYCRIVGLYGSFLSSCYHYIHSELNMLKNYGVRSE